MGVQENLPVFEVKLDKNFDQKMFVEFFKKKNPTVTSLYPKIKTVKDVKEIINYVYKKRHAELETTVTWLQKNTLTLKKIASIISRKFSYSWQEIPKVVIIPSVCPVCPRFLEESSFMVTYNCSHDWILRVCAHELTHFLYFKKLKKLLQKPINTEYPKPDWLISEVVAPIIVNDKEIQVIVHNKDTFYTPNPNLITASQIKEISQLFTNTSDLLVFRQQAHKKIGQ
jgi:hypothetical protein